MYVKAVRAAAAINVHPIARPSSPSVKLTVLEAPTITIATKTRNGTYPRNQNWVGNSRSISRSGAKNLKNGTVSFVE